MKTDLKTEHMRYSLSCQIQRCVCVCGGGGGGGVQIPWKFTKLQVSYEYWSGPPCANYTLLPVTHNNIQAYCMIPCVTVMQKFQLIMTCAMCILCLKILLCLSLFFTSHQKSFSYVGTGLPGLNQY